MSKDSEESDSGRTAGGVIAAIGQALLIIVLLYVAIVVYGILGMQAAGIDIWAL